MVDPRGASRMAGLHWESKMEDLHGASRTADPRGASRMARLHWESKMEDLHGASRMVDLPGESKMEGLYGVKNLINNIGKMEDHHGETEMEAPRGVNKLINKTIRRSHWNLMEAVDQVGDGAKEVAGEVGKKLVINMAEDHLTRVQRKELVEWETKEMVVTVETRVLIGIKNSIGILDPVMEMEIMVLVVGARKVTGTLVQVVLGRARILIGTKKAI